MSQDHAPLLFLATALAYLIHADNKPAVEEKAKFLSLFGKHVSRGEISNDYLQALTAEAFQRARNMELDAFLRDAAADLTHAQKLAVIINLYDVLLADGRVAAGETVIFNRFVGAFDIDAATLRALREILLVKNDTTLFTNRNHPMNEPRYRLDIKLGRS